MSIRLGSRCSKLALVQTAIVCNELSRMGIDYSVVKVKTEGDKRSEPLAKIGGKGLFIKDIENQLIDGKIDMAVHSLKDVPAQLPPGLGITGISCRDDPRDVLLLSRDMHAKGGRVDMSGAAVGAADADAAGAGEAVGTNCGHGTASAAAVARFYQRIHSDSNFYCGNDGIQEIQTIAKEYFQHSNFPRTKFPPINDAANNAIIAHSEVAHSAHHDHMHHFDSSLEISYDELQLQPKKNLELVLQCLDYGARVGTCSIRRKVLLQEARPDLDVVPLRGNVPTRLKKLYSGEFDAIILSVAGLNRLNLIPPFGAKILPVESFMPAVGQGVIAIEYRENCQNVELFQSHFNSLRNLAEAVSFYCERSFIETIDGHCLTPVGAYSWLNEGKIYIYSMLASDNGTKVMYDFRSTDDNSIIGAKNLGSLSARALISAVNAQNV